MLDEVRREAAERLEMGDQRAAGLRVGLVEDQSDRPRRRRLDIGRERPAAGRDEEGQGATTGHAAVGGLGVPAHAPLRDHHRGDPVGGLEVVRRAARHLVEQDLLGGAAAHQRDQPGAEVGLRRQVVVLLAADRHAERLAVGEQRDLLDLPLVAMDLAADGVADLVGGDDRALPFVHRPPPRRSDGHLQPAGMEVLGLERLGAAAGREDRGLVQEVGEHRAGEPVRLAGDLLEVGRDAQRLVPRMDVEDLPTALHVRHADVDLPVEAAGPQHRRIEDVDPVRRGDDDHVVGRREPVELDQQLVQRLLAFLVAVRAAARLSDGVELVEEDDPAAQLPGLGEEIADPLRADADVFLDELRARRVVERDAGFGRDPASEHRLAGARRPPQQDPARDPGAEPAEAVRRAQELDRLGQLELGLVAAGDVVEGDAADRRAVAVGDDVLGGVGRIRRQDRRELRGAVAHDTAGPS